MPSEVYLAIAGFLCGTALLFLMISRTMKKRGTWTTEPTITADQLSAND